MAWENPKEILEGVVAGADLTSSQDSFVVIDNTGAVVLNTVAGGVVDGVLIGKPDVGEPASVALGGRCILRCGAAVAAGDLVQSDNQGRAITALSGTFAAGRALSATSNAEERLTVVVKPAGYLP